MLWFSIITMTTLESVISEATLEAWSTAMEHFARDFLGVGTLIELVIVASLAMVAWPLSRLPRKSLGQLAERYTEYPLLVRFSDIFAALSFPLSWLVLQWVANFGARLTDSPVVLMVITASLLTAWVVIRVVSAFLKNRVVANTVAIIAWTMAALNIVGLLDDTITVLDGVGFTLGTARITLLTLSKGVVLLGVLLWASNILSEFFESRIKNTADLTPSVQVLFAKIFKVSLLAVAMLLAVSATGIDLTAFAVVGGAIGVGIGFGLQKIVSNLVSGVILLLDDSIKPGDVIAVADYYGRVDSLGARYVSVMTRDGVEHLIPNEELIINRVENWSHSNNLLRLRLGVGVHYKSDVDLARTLMFEAAKETPRVLDDPKPNVLMRNFGDNSVDLEIRYWINDPMNGRANVASDVLTRVWHKFAANNIEIPYPQRDIHLRTPLWDEVRDASARD